MKTWGKWFTLGLPAVFMAIMLIISATPIGEGETWDNIFLVFLVTLLPLLFMAQGILSILTKTNILLSIFVSLVMFAILMYIQLDIGALTYALINVIAAFIGYYIMKLFKKLA